jgi:hypothetical protein
VPIVLLLALPARAQEPPTQPPKKTDDPIPDAVPVPDRWRIPFSDYPLNEPGRLWDPYHQNVLKGDYPILGQDIFMALSARNDTTAEFRRLPTPSGVSTARPNSPDFFGSGDQALVVEQVSGTLELYEGLTSFRPRDWEIRVTGVGNYNYTEVRENAIVNPDVTHGVRRTDHFQALQEALGEVHLMDVSDSYDFVSFRAGIQPFVSDFRGFLFSDTNLGARLFGTLASNRIQWNLAVFDMLEKDTNSDLNTFQKRNEWVGIANVYVQDFLFPGYTAEASVHVVRDEATTHYDTNDFLVRPALLGTVREHRIGATYLGWAGDGHVGTINVSHALYSVFGQDRFNELAGRQTDILAWMAAFEVSQDIDWIRVRASFFWSSGDAHPGDNRATGFDTILDAPNFAGGPFSFWNRQALRLQGVNLVQRQSLVPDLRSSKTEGQANFVNPGLFLYNLGMDLDLLPEVKAILNGNFMNFQDTRSLQSFAFQSNIRRNIGAELSLGLLVRPFLNNNVIATLGGSAFFPGGGFEDLYDSRRTLFSAFAQLTLLY